MDPRPSSADPLTSAAADLELLDQASEEDQVEIFGRIHASLASALAGTGADFYSDTDTDTDTDTGTGTDVGTRSGPGPGPGQRSGG